MVILKLYQVQAFYKFLKNQNKLESTLFQTKRWLILEKI